MPEQEVLDQANRDNAPFYNMVIGAKTALSAIAAIRETAIAFGWSPGSSMSSIAEWYLIKLGELELMREDMATLRSFAENRGWSEDDDEPAHEFMENALDDWEDQIAALAALAQHYGWDPDMQDESPTAPQYLRSLLVDRDRKLNAANSSVADWETQLDQVSELARRYGRLDGDWFDKPAIDYLVALLGDLSDQYKIRQPILRTAAPLILRSCKNCHKEIYCGTRKDAWKLAGDSGHIDNDDLLFSALADSCTVYSRKVDQ